MEQLGCLRDQSIHFVIEEKNRNVDLNQIGLSSTPSYISFLKIGTHFRSSMWVAVTQPLEP